MRLRREEIFRTHPRSGPLPLTAQREVDEIDAKISALQRRTDDAKDDINRATFTYEQYFKIASQVLSQLTEIIKKFAANLARS